jgi:hypothetical protein
LVRSLFVAGRYNGPLDSGNGGYTAGAVAALLEGPTQLSLRRPVPLDRQLEAIVGDGTARVLDGDDLIADAVQAADFELEVPTR